MASEVSHRHSATGETLYFTIRNTTRQMWNTGGTPNFETLTVANWTSYKIAMSESPASSYFYAGTFPAISGNMVAGWYWCDVFKQAGGSAAIGDTLYASYHGYWDGTTYKFWGDDTIQIGGTAQTAVDLGAINVTNLNTLSSHDPGATIGTSTLTAADAADAVWDENIVADHQSASTAGIAIHTIWNDAAAVYEVEVARSGSVNDLAATTTVFKTTLNEADDFWNDSLLCITSGALSGQNRPILDYAQTNGVVTVSEPFTSAPANAVNFVIKRQHVHPISAIQDAITGGAYPLSDASFAFDSALDLTTTQKASVTDAVPRKVKKNTALAAFQFVLIDATTKVPVAGKTVTVTRSIDGGAFAAGTLSAVAELSNGVYGIDFAAADLNGNVILLLATATGCDPTIERILTTP